MLNIENIKKVRDFIASLPPKRKVNMSTWGAPLDEDLPSDHLIGAPAEQLIKADCGTVACIAGWTCALLAPQTSLSIYNTPDKAQQLFGLTQAQANALFFAIPSEGEARGWDRTYDDRDPKWPDLDEITADQAVATLDRLIETGEVRW